MPTLPWTPATEAARSESESPESDVVVLGSQLVLNRYRDIPGFLRAALQIRKQVRDSHGAVGVSLIAQPARKTFWTLSAWNGDDALQAFVRTPPHVGVMGRYHGRMQGSRFTTWTIPVAALPKAHSNAKDLWHDARARLAQQGADR